MSKVKVLCPRCLGTGETWKSIMLRRKRNKVTCPQCKGKKYLWVSKPT